jgi:hypothetical protein
MWKLISRFFFGTPEKDIKQLHENIYLRKWNERLTSENKLLKLKEKSNEIQRAVIK